MNLSDNENKLYIKEIHDELIKIDPWGTAKNGKFTGQLVFDYSLSTGNDVAVYEFYVDDLIDDFIFGHECGIGGKLDEDGQAKATIIIDNLKQMISRIEKRLVDV